MQSPSSKQAHCFNCGSKIEAADPFCRVCGDDRRALIGAANSTDDGIIGQGEITVEPPDSRVPELVDGAGAVGNHTDKEHADVPEEYEKKERRNHAWLAIPAFVVLAVALVGGLVYVIYYAGRPQREVRLNLRAPRVLGCEPVRKLLREFLKNEGVSDSEIGESATRCETEGELKLDGPIARKATHVTLDVLLCDSSATVFDDMLNGDCDIGISWRQVNPDENSKLRKSGFGDMSSNEQECMLANDGIEVIVNDKNPLNSISQESLRDIFVRKTKVWDQVGSPDNKWTGPINIYVPSEKVEIVKPFRDALGLTEPIKEDRDVKVFDDSAEVSHRVAVDNQGIGFVNVVNRGDRAKPLRVLKGDGSNSTAGAAAYLAFSYPLYLYRSPKANEYAEKFRLFVIDGKARKPLEDARLDPLIPKQTSTAELKRSPKYKELTAGAFQLDFNCLFGPSDSKLTGDSLTKVEEWAKSRSRLDDKGYKNILVLGFASRDGDGQEGPMNMKLSRDRAQEVAKIITKYWKPATVNWFGAAEPLFGSAEDETDEGRRLNRRVEIWLRP